MILKAWLASYKIYSSLPFLHSIPKLQSVSSGSTLPTPQPSATFLPSASVSSSSLASSTAAGGGGGGETGGLPLSVLAAGLQQTANNQDEGDDDYDE